MGAIHISAKDIGKELHGPITGGHADDTVFGDFDSDLPAMMRADVWDVASEADAMIVTHANDLYRDVLAQTPETPVIDVVRVEKEMPLAANYNGIGW